MKKIFSILFLFMLFSPQVYARDFIVDFLDENYKETQAQFSYTPLIYHSIQVNSIAGPKILILKGDNYLYRKWLRHYIAQGKKFIAKIPDEDVDKFISEKAYSIDVTFLHPFNGEKWGKRIVNDPAGKQIKGNNHILIVDPNGKRTHLVQIVVKKKGYDPIVFASQNQAFDVFKLQPDKFKMVIVQHSVAGATTDKFIEKLLKLNHTIPIIIDTGYNNPKINNQMMSKFSNHGSVHIKPVILRDLQKTIESLIQKNV